MSKKSGERVSFGDLGKNNFLSCATPNNLLSEYNPCKKLNEKVELNHWGVSVSHRSMNGNVFEQLNNLEFLCKKKRLPYLINEFSRSACKKACTVGCSLRQFGIFFQNAAHCYICCRQSTTDSYSVWPSILSLIAVYSTGHCQPFWK